MFQKSPAFEKLSQWAKQPVDLTQPGVFSPERIQKMSVEGEGMRLFYGAERVTEEVIEGLYELAEERGVCAKMEAMQSGEAINQIEGFESERRAVLHTAMRDQFGIRQKGPRAKEAALMAAKELEKLQRWLEENGEAFTDLIQIGIGGSDLGPRALYMALRAFGKRGKRVHFISNVDPDDANQVLEEVNLKKTVVVVVSKSGTTLETLTNEAFVRERMEKIGLNPNRHFIAVTGEGSPMDNPERYLACFYIWDFVGGRYSATSMVGAVMLSFALGFEGFMEILRGAHEMDQHALQKEGRHNLPLLWALLGIWNRNFLHYPTLAVIPYSQGLIRFPAHLQQLDMESNGKRVDQKGERVDFVTGPIVWGEPGTNGQHSFYQLIHQGTDVVPLEFIGFKKSQCEHDVSIEGTTSQEKLLSNLFAQSIALAIGQKSENPNKVFPGNRPNRILILERLTPRNLGKLLAFYEHKVAFQGFLWGINSFDQEGVQLGKVLAGKMLSLFKGEKGSFPLGEAYMKFLS